MQKRTPRLKQTGFYINYLFSLFSKFNSTLVFHSSFDKQAQLLLTLQTHIMSIGINFINRNQPVGMVHMFHLFSRDFQRHFGCHRIPVIRSVDQSVCVDQSFRDFPCLRIIGKELRIQSQWNRRGKGQFQRQLFNLFRRINLQIEIGCVDKPHIIHGK